MKNDVKMKVAFATERKIKMEQNFTLESQLISYKTFIPLSAEEMVFQDVTLKVKIGKYEAGAHFASAYFSTGVSLLGLEDVTTDGSHGTRHYFRLAVSVGEEEIDIDKFEADLSKVVKAVKDEKSHCSDPACSCKLLDELEAMLPPGTIIN